MSPHDENVSGRTSVPGSGPHDPARESSQKQESPAETKREFRTFDRAGMPEAKKLKDPELRGRLRRSMDNRSRRKRRQRMLRWVVIPSAVGFVFLVLVGLTLRNLLSQDDAAETTGSEPAHTAPTPAAAYSESQEAAIERPPSARLDPNHSEPSSDVQSARDRFLLRTGSVERGAEISDESRDALRAAGLPASGDTTHEGEGEAGEISEDEKMRLLRKAAPYSRTVRKAQANSDASPKDLYLPESKPAK